METIRRLELQDLEDLLDIRIQYQIEKFKDKENIDIEKLRKETKLFLLKRLNKDIYFFGTFVDNKLVSICGLNVLNYLPQINDLMGYVGLICSVYTYPTYRKRGYQHKTLEKVLQFAKLINIKRIHLTSSNEYAIKMYKKFGFDHSTDYFSHYENI